MIDEFENNAEQELKRSDHLIYVTLKYTRTVDVIKNTIKRLIAAFDFAITDLLEYFNIRPSPIPLIRASQLVKKKTSLKNYITFYLFLRKLDKEKYQVREEYRKNVTLVTNLANVNIPILEEYFLKTKEFVRTVAELME